MGTAESGRHSHPGNQCKKNRNGRHPAAVSAPPTPAAPPLLPEPPPPPCPPLPPLTTTEIIQHCEARCKEELSKAQMESEATLKLHEPFHADVLEQLAKVFQTLSEFRSPREAFLNLRKGGPSV